MLTKITNHPCLQYANELKTICHPLQKIGIHYFSHVYIDEEKRFSALSNHPEFSAHYLTNRYYNGDIHLAESKELSNYIMWDTIELSAHSRKINHETQQFGIKHLFTVIEKDKAQGMHYYHFATNTSQSSINQFYINNIDLLNLFIRYFKANVEKNYSLSFAYQIKFNIDTKAKFTLLSDINTFNTPTDKDNFLKELNLNKFNNFMIRLTPQQSKCVKLLLDGYSVKQIACHMKLSKRTIENYLARVRSRLGCRSSREMMTRYFSQDIKMAMKT